MSRSLFPLSPARSVVVVLAAMLLALALVVASALDPKKAEADRVVTRTFNQPQQILIPAGAIVADCNSGPTEGQAAPYPSQLRIAAFPERSTILDVNLVIRNYTHTFPDDVGVLLSKGGKNLLVMDDVGDGDDVSAITLTLDDEAAAPLPNEEQLVSGSFKPTNQFDVNAALSAYDGVRPNGTWNLYVSDEVEGDCGEFGGGWSLIIRARVP
jgi:hypothetical protein